MFDDELEGRWGVRAVEEQRCAGGASSGATCVTSKRRDQGRVIARSAVVLHFLTGFRTEQVALCIWQRTLLSPVDVKRLVRLMVNCS